MEIDLATERPITMKQAASMLGVCHRTVQNYAASGALRTIKPAGLRLTTARLVSEFLHRNAPAPEATRDPAEARDAILKKWTTPNDSTREAC